MVPAQSSGNGFVHAGYFSVAGRCLFWNHAGAGTVSLSPAHPPSPDSHFVPVEPAAALARYLRADRVSLLSAPPLAGAAHRGALRRRRRHAAGRGAGADRAAASAFAAGRARRALRLPISCTDSMPVRHHPGCVLCLRLSDAGLYKSSLQRFPDGGGVHALCMQRCVSDFRLPAFRGAAGQNLP